VIRVTRNTGYWKIPLIRELRNCRDALLKLNEAVAEVNPTDAFITHTRHENLIKEISELVDTFKNQVKRLENNDLSLSKFYEELKRHKSDSLKGSKGS
jgi:chaperonin cofactor prefoldin